MMAKVPHLRAHRHQHAVYQSRSEAAELSGHQDDSRILQRAHLSRKEGFSCHFLCVPTLETTVLFARNCTDWNYFEGSLQETTRKIRKKIPRNILTVLLKRTRMICIAKEIISKILHSELHKFKSSKFIGFSSYFS